MCSAGGFWTTPKWKRIKEKNIMVQYWIITRKFTKISVFQNWKPISPQIHEPWRVKVFSLKVWTCQFNPDKIYFWVIFAVKHCMLPVWIFPDHCQLPVPLWCCCPDGNKAPHRSLPLFLLPPYWDAEDNCKGKNKKTWTFR